MTNYQNLKKIDWDIDDNVKAGKYTLTGYVGIYVVKDTDGYYFLMSDNGTEYCCGKIWPCLDDIEDFRNDVMN